MPTELSIINNTKQIPFHTSGEWGNLSAFAMIRTDGSVVTWGNDDAGGNNASVAVQLNGAIEVTQIYSTNAAFAALRSDGSVVAWGDPNYGGNSSSVEALNGTIRATHIYSTKGAFAALRNDGSVIVWGGSTDGGDNSEVADQLNGTIAVTQIFSTAWAFAALRSDGSVITWGLDEAGGESSPVSSQLDGTIDVIQIFSNSYAFAALRSDGSVVTWGNGSNGGDSSLVASQLDGGEIKVIQVYATDTAFAALRSDGSVVTWGEEILGGDSKSVAPQLTGVLQVYSTGRAFAALRSDGSVVTWGDDDFGGDSNGVTTQLIDVIQIFSNSHAFAALRSDGSVITWGNGSNGGNSNSVTDQLNGTTDVLQIYATDTAFAALRSDGSVVTWGGDFGGNSSLVATQLNGDTDVIQIFSNSYAFAALRSDGSMITWGYGDYGGDSNLTSGIVSGANIYTDDWFTTPPTVISFIPVDGATGVATTANLEFTFTEPIQRGTGSLVLQTTDGATVEIFDAATSNRLTLSGSTLTVDPTSPLANGTNYSLTLAAGTITDLAGNNYGGTTNYNFTTALADGLTLNGTSGDDTLTGGAGNDLIDGGAGIDTVVLTALPSQYRLSGTTLTGIEGIDTLVNIEQYRFGSSLWNDNYVVTLAAEFLIDADGNGPEVSPAKDLLQGISDLYIAYFNRAPDVEGLLYWFREVFNGTWTLATIAQSFTDQPEYRATYPEGLLNREFIDKIYQNIFDREPDPAGWAYWEKDLDRGVPRDVFIYSVILGAYAETGGAEDRALLSNKHAVSLYYSEQLATHAAEVYDFAIEHVLNRVTADPETVVRAEKVIDFVIADTIAETITLTGVVADPPTWEAFWT